MNKIKNNKYTLLICLFVLLNKGLAQEISLNHYKISNSEFKSIIRSIVDYNSKKIKEEKVFEYDYFWIEIKKNNNQTLLTISRVKKDVIDFEFKFNGQKGFFKFRNEKFIVSGFDKRLFKIKQCEMKYQIVFNNSNIITTSFNSEFEYWEYYLNNENIVLKYAPDDFI